MLLLNGSICLQICLVLLIVAGQSDSQDYESGYGVDEDHSDIQDESDHPDYSKYYSVDTSAPLITAQNSNPDAGFFSAAEFSSFFGPSSPLEFGASGKQEVTQPKNPFVAKESKTTGFTDDRPELYSTSSFPRDYFEESQKKQREENQEESANDNFELTPGPNYISHQLPGKYTSALEGGYTGEVEKIDSKTPKYKNNKKSKDYDVDYEKSSSAEADYPYEYSSPAPGKYVDYNTGKSSSTVSQHPAAPGFAERYTTTSTPYQKYSFQPVSEGGSSGGFESKYLEGLISTVAPFNPAYSKLVSTVSTPVFESQPSENIPSHLKGKGCKRVKKNVDEHTRSKREAMDCYVCEDPKSSTKYTQCSYNSAPDAKNEYSGKSERYSTPSREPDGFRYKRYSGDDYNYNTDPYEYIKRRSQAEYKEPKEQKEETRDYEEYKVPDDYSYYSEAPDKSFSELQSEEITKNPANCFKEEKSGMTCTICKDPKTGGNFEQCSYTSAPKEQKYAYVTEKKYNSNDQPEEESKTKPVKSAEVVTKNKEAENIEKFKKYNPAEEFERANQESLDLKYEPIKKKLFEEDNNNQERDSYRSREDYSAPEPSRQQRGKNNPKKLVEDDPYEVPKHFADETKINEKKSGLRKLHGSEDSSEEADSASDEKSLPYKDIDEYHFKLFPEFSNEESQQAEVVAKSPVETTRKDVEEVLAEFSKKDRSACKKAEKNGMTCYLCVDAKGIQHEECMYVSESKPQASHVAYHEVKQIKSPDGGKSELEPAATEIKQRKKFFKKATSTPSPFSLEASASEEVEAKIKYNNKSSKSRNRNLKNKNKKNKKDAVSASSNFDEDHERIEEDPEHPDPKTPAEFQVGDEEGAYSEEVQPVYSKRHGARLPKYMLEKSAFEQEFDEFAGVNY